MIQSFYRMAATLALARGFNPDKPPHPYLGRVIFTHDPGRSRDHLPPPPSRGGDATNPAASAWQRPLAIVAGARRRS